MSTKPHDEPSVNINSGPYWEHYSEYAVAGYQPRPVKHDTKGCFVKGWRADVSVIEVPTKQRSAATGLSLRTGHRLADGSYLVVLDADRDDVVRLARAVVGSPGSSPCERFGSKGGALFARTLEQPKGFKLGNGSGEFLAGAICVVLPTIHPKTGKPYRWIGASLLEVGYAQLPVVDPQLIRVAFGSDYLPTVLDGQMTHDAVLGFVAQLAAVSDDPELIERVVTAALPEDYAQRIAGNDSLSELPGMIRSALRKYEGGEWQRPTSASSAIEEMNRSYAVTRVMNTAAVLYEYTDQENRPAFSLLSAAALTLLLDNRFVTSPDGKPTSLVNYWRRHRDRRSYDGIMFAAAGAPSRYYNLWRGFAVEPDSAGTCELFKAHLLDNVCQGDAALFAWVFGWFAQIFQQPDQKCGTALVLRGPQGVGKTIVFKTFGYLLGEHYVKVSSPRYVTGRFNSHLASCLLFFSDEAIWAGDHEAEGMLKGLVTGDRHFIELKGHEAFSVANYVRFGAAGNRDWLVPAELQERREAVLDVGDGHQQDIPYFAAIEAELAAGGYARLLHELLQFDLSTVELRVIPKTEALLEQKVETLTLEQKWWLSMLEQGFLPEGCFEDNEAPTEAVFDNYVEFAGKLRTRERLAIQTKLGMFLKKVTKGRIRRLHQNCFYRNQMGRYRVYEFPPLAECRQLWDEAIKHPNNWGDADQQWEKDPKGKWEGDPEEERRAVRGEKRF